MTQLLSRLGGLFRPAAPRNPQPALRAVETLAGQLGGIKTYRSHFDEALRNNRQDALAMRRDARLMGWFDERKRPVSRSRWHVEPEGKNDPAQQAVADGLTTLVKKIPYFTRFRRGLLDYVWYGRHAMQVVPGPVKVNGRDAVGVLAHQPVNGDKINFDTDDGTPVVLIYPGIAERLKRAGATVVMTDRAPALKLDRPEWRRRFVIGTYDPEDADYLEPELAGSIHGLGIRGRLYWTDFMRNEAVGWVMDYMQRMGAGGLTLVFYDEGNASSLEAARKVGRDLESGNVLLVPRPKGTTKQTAGVERIEASPVGTQFLLQLVKDYFDAIEERYVIGQHMSDGGSGGELGGTGRAQFAADSKYEILASDAEDLDQILTSDLIEPLRLWNYADAPGSYRFVSDLQQPDPDKTLDAITKATAIGVRFDEDAVRGLTGMEKPAPDADVVGGKQQLPAAGPGGTELPGGGGSVPADAGDAGNEGPKPRDKNAPPDRNVPSGQLPQGKPPPPKPRQFARATDDEPRDDHGRWSVSDHQRVSAGRLRSAAAGVPDDDAMRDELSAHRDRVRAEARAKAKAVQGLSREKRRGYVRGKVREAHESKKAELKAGARAKRVALRAEARAVAKESVAFVRRQILGVVWPKLRPLAENGAGRRDLADNLKDVFTAYADEFRPGGVLHAGDLAGPDRFHPSDDYRVRDFGRHAHQAFRAAVEYGFPRGPQFQTPLRDAARRELLALVGMEPTGRDLPHRFARRRPRRFARAGADGGGRWITIGGKKGEGGERHGGSPVYVKNGRIIKGAPSLAGKKLGAMGEDVKGSAREHGVRSQWVSEAKKRGVKADDLHALAGQIREHDAALTDERAELTREAHRRSREKGFTDLRTAHLNEYHGRGDADGLKGLDEIAADMAAAYPHHFAGYGDPVQRLHDMILEGTPGRMTLDDAYGQALDQLERYPVEPADVSDKPWSWDEDEDDRPSGRAA